MNPEYSSSELVTTPRGCGKRKPRIAFRWLRMGIASLCSLLVLANTDASAQNVNLRPSQFRVTVPIGSTDTTVISNILVDVSGISMPVEVNVTGLPAGAGYTLTTSDGTPFTSTSDDTNIVLTVYTTNITAGIHTFYLNATGGATRTIPLEIQSAHIWNGSLNVSNNWNSASSWLGGIPTSTGDVVFGTRGGQTNNSFPSGISFTNIGLDASTTIGSLRFSQNAGITSDFTNALYHTLSMAPNTTLTITGTNGFTLLRDTIDELDSAENRTMGVNIVGGANSRIVVSNEAANVAVLIGESQSATLNMSNLTTFTAYVNRVGFADYKLFPHYNEYNEGGNFNANPRDMAANIYLARSNFITALYVGPDNYDNEFTRTYAITTLQPGETHGQGSATPNLRFYLGFTNAFFADSFCIVGANGATGNAGEFRFNPAFGTNSGAMFRGTNGTGRMSVFSIADDGGPIPAQSTVRANVVDFSGGVINLLADRFYMSRDRTLIISNQNPVVESQLTIGRGVVDVNMAFLGYQEHDGKTNWTEIGGAEAYRNYCRADLIVNNGGIFRVNGTLTLGYTADTNPEAVAEQYNTRGTVTINQGGTVMADTIVADGGLNFVSISQPRNNRITINQGTLIVTNQIGAEPGLPLDSLSMTEATLNLRVVAGRTNVYVRNFLNLGGVPSTIRISSVSGVTSYPTNIPLISYETATPFITADVSGATGLAPGAQGYILNNPDTKTIELYLTTNAPNTLVWRGNVNNNWDLTTKNWVTAAGNIPTNFSLGDFVTFDDTAVSGEVAITEVVVPAQSGGAGVTITNNTLNYTFNAVGGAIAGTASLVKSGSGSLEFNAAESGPLTVLGGTLTGSGILGTVTVASNVVVDFGGSMSGLTSTGTVTVALGGSVNGIVSLQGGSLTVDGLIDTAALSTGFTIVNTRITNNGTINVRGTANPAMVMDVNSVLANHGIIRLFSQRFNFSGLVFGDGFFIDNDGGLLGADARVNMLSDNRALLSPGAEPFNSIGTLYFGNRLDLHAGNPNNNAGILLIEVDFSHPQVHDKLQVDRWNNIASTIIITNINPGAGQFEAGQMFRIFENNNGITESNFVDTAGIWPLILPAVPGPGLQWDLSRVREYGEVSIVASPLVWDGNGSGEWAVSVGGANWKAGQTYTDSQGAIFNDTAVGTTTINLTGAVAPGGFSRVTNIVEGVSTNFVNSAPPVVPGVVFDNSSKNYTISGTGKIFGAATLYKRGSGTLTILTTNEFIGGAILEGGIVEMGNIQALGVVATTANTFGAQGAYNQFVIDGAGLNYLGMLNANLNRAMTIKSGGASIGVASATNELTLSTAVRGEGSLTKVGPGTLVLSQSGHAYQGGTEINEGAVRLTTTAAGFGPISLGNGVALELSGNFTLTNAIQLAGSGSTLAVLGSSTLTSSGPWSGGGSVTFNNTNLFTFRGSLSALSGTISFGTTSGRYRFNATTNDNIAVGSADAEFDLGTGASTLNVLNGAGLTYHLGALNGGPDTVLFGASTNADLSGTTFSIGAKGTDSVFNGRITNGLDTVSVTKVGAGKLLLNGANTYTGPTLVTAGTLGGTGSINGSLTVQSGATLAPGVDIGTFTVNGTATLQGITVMELNRNASPIKNDRLVATTIVGGGTLIVTNVGPDIANGTTFQLFSSGVSGFTSVVLPTSDPLNTKTYTWENNIAANGSITLVSGGSTGVDTTPTEITTTVGGGVLTLTWPTSHIGWQLWSNSVSLTDTGSWFLVSGSEQTNRIDSAIDPSKTNVFFRLLLP